MFSLPFFFFGGGQVCDRELAQLHDVLCFVNDASIVTFDSLVRVLRRGLYQLQLALDTESVGRPPPRPSTVAVVSHASRQQLPRARTAEPPRTNGDVDGQLLTIY